MRLKQSDFIIFLKKNRLISFSVFTSKEFGTYIEITKNGLVLLRAEENQFEPLIDSLISNATLKETKEYHFD